MASPRIQVVIGATVDGLEKGARKAGEAIDKIGNKVGGLGKGSGPTSFFDRLGGAARGAAENGLGPLGEAASGLGVEMGAMAGPQMAALAGIMALGTAAVSSVKQFEALAMRVRDFSMKAGIGAEASSRLIANMDDLGISTESGATALGRLARNIDAGKLDQYGIAVARTKDGTVDMEATLRNVADAMANTDDPTKRATMGTDLLGKSYADLYPLLNLGSDGMKKFSDSVSDAQVMTEENIRQAQDLGFALDDLKESFSNVSLAAGKGLSPVLTQVASDIGALTGATTGSATEHSKFSDAVKWLAFIGIPYYRTALANAAKNHADLAEKVKAGREQQETAAAAAKAQADAERQLAKDMKLATDAAKVQRDVMAGLKKAQDDLIDTALSFDEVQMNAWESQQELTAAFDDLANGTGDYTERLVKAEKAVKPYIDKQWELYKTQKELNGVALDAGDKADFYNRKLADLIGITGDPNLNGRLMDLARLIAGVSGETEGAAAAFANWIRQISAVGLQDLVGAYAEAGAPVPDSLQKIIDAANGVKPPGRAVGGNVSAGQPTVVGEAGPELFVPQSNGRILTAEDLARVGGGGGRSVVINVHSPIGRPDDVVRWIREEIRRLDRSAR